MERETQQEVEQQIETTTLAHPEVTRLQEATAPIEINEAAWAEQDEAQIVKDLLQLLESPDPAVREQIDEALQQDERLYAYLKRQIQDWRSEREPPARVVQEPEQS